MNNKIEEQILKISNLDFSVNGSGYEFIRGVLKRVNDLELELKLQITIKENMEIKLENLELKGRLNQNIRNSHKPLN